MSSTEIFNTRELPIFPLPLVLFPGALLPLHIFEERYKEMIKDSLASDKLFGITYLAENETWPPPVGRIGAIAQIMAVVPLDGGRMNILTVGINRYRVIKYIEKKSYLKAEVELIQDQNDDYDTNTLMEEVKKLYKRAAEALKALNDEQTLPSELPDGAEDFSFGVAAVLQLPLEKKQPLLEIRSSGLRLTKLRHHLSSIIEDYEHRASIHTKAKSNGHGSSKVLDSLKKE
ncbi:MAG: LON peptidase substrate-binding domain-containing protein [Acidobacteria bacterium]|nr:LON peptidase substrate-binding domain-containing protein [Acidobacteriota bacterium]